MLQGGMRIIHASPMFTVDIIIHHTRLQRAWAKQCDEGNQVVEIVRLQPLDELLHALRFELEYSRRIHSLN